MSKILSRILMGLIFCFLDLNSGSFELNKKSLSFNILIKKLDIIKSLFINLNETDYWPNFDYNLNLRLKKDNDESNILEILDKVWDKK